MWKNLLIVMTSFFIAGKLTAVTETMQLTLPIVSETPNSHEYFHALLKNALKDAGIVTNFAYATYPQIRLKKILLKAGSPIIYWMVESAERNKNYLPIKVGITNGLIGRRVLLIKKGTQKDFDNVHDLNGFRKLNKTGGFGTKWFDVNVWQANNLKFKEQAGNWRSIYKMLALGRDFHYFSRGLNEIVADSNKYPDLEIEKNLVLIYDRDFRFYMSKGSSNSSKITEIENALKEYQKSGKMEKLIRKFWSNDFVSLNYEKRVKIKLKTP